MEQDAAVELKDELCVLIDEARSQPGARGAINMDPLSGYPSHDVILVLWAGTSLPSHNDCIMSSNNCAVSSLAGGEAS